MENLPLYLVIVALAISVARLARVAARTFPKGKFPDPLDLLGFVGSIAVAVAVLDLAVIVVAWKSIR